MARSKKLLTSINDLLYLELHNYQIDKQTPAKGSFPNLATRKLFFLRSSN